MNLLIIIASLALLMYVAYKGFSVIIFAPIIALFAVLCTDPALVLPYFSGIFMDKVAGFVKLYFPVFLLGALFGKLISLSGFATSLTQFIIKRTGSHNALLAIVVVCAVLTYSGVSLFVVVFAVYPFAAELFRFAKIPKRLIPATIALGAFTFTMDAFPGSPQIQNIIPTTFFKTTIWAAPVLGITGGLFIFFSGLYYLNLQAKKAKKYNEGYGVHHEQELDNIRHQAVPPWWIALLPLLVVGIANKILINVIGNIFGPSVALNGPNIAPNTLVDVTKLATVWSVECALVLGIVVILILAWKNMQAHFKTGAAQSVSGALLAALNTASEYGFGGIIAALPGFSIISNALTSLFKDPLLNVAITTSMLAGITGSSSGGMSIALGAMGERYLEMAAQHGIDAQVLHRVTAMASGGMDTLPHNGAIITLLAITGLTHKQSYKDIFIITIIKTIAAFLVIGLYHLLGSM